MYDPDKYAAFLEELRAGGDAEPEQVSAAEVMKITQGISGAVFDLYRRRG